VIELSWTATDKRGMTFDELEQFVKAARDAGCSGRDRIRATVGLGGKVKVLRTAGPAPDDDRRNY
jgi:hypothetical protein